MSPAQAAESRLPPGTVVAGYRIEARIGRGGMATVYRAHDERLGRTVALKILVPALALDDEFRARFIRESRVAAAVDHPHIIPVYEAGEANGVLFIAMRFVRGGDLRWHLSQSGQLAPEVVADIVSQIASALDAAHKRGLVHRDIKPGNVLLDVSGDTDEPDHVYLSDFGLSKDSISAGTMTALTSTGQVLGTLDYMAPEQIEGKAIDGRADQYALACTAYELLCGTPPFGDHPSTALMRAHRSDKPPPISSRRPRLPRGIDLVFARALAKAPGDRYSNCRDFAAALRTVSGLEQYRSGLQFTPRYQSDPQIAAALASRAAPVTPPAPANPAPTRQAAPATPPAPAHQTPPTTPPAPARQRPPASPATPAEPAPASPPRPFTPTGPAIHPVAAATTIRRRDLPPKPAPPKPAPPKPAPPKPAPPKPAPPKPAPPKPAPPGPTQAMPTEVAQVRPVPTPPRLSPAHADRTEVDWDAMKKLDKPTESPPAHRPAPQPSPRPPRHANSPPPEPDPAATPAPEPPVHKRHWPGRRDQR